MVVFAIEATLFGFIGAFCSLLGIALAILSHISARKSAAEEASRKCHEALLAEERMTEKLSKELKELRVKYGEADD